MPKVLRIVECFIDNDWYVCTMSELNKGDAFRLLEAKGKNNDYR